MSLVQQITTTNMTKNTTKTEDEFVLSLSTELGDVLVVWSC